MPDEAGEGTVAETATAEATVDLTDEQWGKTLGLDPADSKELDYPDSEELEPDEARSDDTKDKSSDDTKHVDDSTDGDEDAKGDVKADEGKSGDADADKEGEGDKETDEGKEEVDPNTFASLGRDPVTEFSVGDTEGDIETPNLTFSYKANGKEQTDVPIDKLVHMAQMGHYSHDREQTLVGRETAVQQASDQYDQLLGAYNQQAASSQQMSANVARLLSDPEYYDAARERHEVLNSPEQRVQRAEQAAVQARQQASVDAETTQIRNFVQYDLTPKFQGILTESSNVNQEELLGRYTALMAPHLVRGALPVGSLQAVGHLVETDLAQWAKQVHESRQGEQKAQDDKLDQQREKTAKAKRKLSRAAVPRGKAQADKPKIKQAKATDSAEDTMETLFGELEAEAR